MGMKRLYLQSSKLFLTFFVTYKKGTRSGFRITLTITLSTLYILYVKKKLITNIISAVWLQAEGLSDMDQNFSANFSSTMSNKSQVDSELYRRYLDNRSVSDSIYFFLIVIHAILMVFGTVGNIVVLLAISMVKSKTLSFFLHIHRNVAGLSLAHNLDG